MKKYIGKNYKKIWTTTLLVSLATQNLVPAFSNSDVNFGAEIRNINDIEGNDDITGDYTRGVIDVIIRFDIGETFQDVSDREIRVELYDKTDTIIKTINLYEDDADNFYYDDQNNLSYWKISQDVLGGNDGDVYTLKFSGVNHRDFIVPNIDLSQTSKSITVGTGDGTFAYGDLNKDDNVDENDIAYLEELIKSQDNFGEIPDGVTESITIMDYTKLVSIVKKVEQQTIEGLANVIASTNFLDISDIASIRDEDIKELEQIATIDGNLSDILVDGNTNPVTIIANSNTSEITIPISITQEEGIELSQIEIISPIGEGAITKGTALIEYIDDNGEEQSMYVNFGDTAISNDSSVQEASIQVVSDLTSRSYNIAVIDEQLTTNTIVISLGTRIVVKKISVTVDVDEDNNFVVIQEVNFVQDIVPENPYGSDGLIDNVKATGGDKTVSLTWDKAENVGGYRVSYGETSGNYTNFEDSTTNSATISLTENLINHYFVVQSTYNDWSSAYSSEVMAMGLPSSVPTAPTSIIVNELDQALSLSWTAGRDASTHNVYIKKEDETEYELIAEGLINPSYSIGGLENDITYNIVVSCSNFRGEGAKSGMAEGTPFKLLVDGPILPEHNRIDNSNITSVSMVNSSNYYESLYPNGYSPDIIYDEDYATYWQSRNWYNDANFVLTFDEPKTMNYLIWVPCVEENAYAETLAEYNISVKTLSNPDGENLIYNTATTYNETVTVQTDENGIKYCVMPFDKRENITEITVGTWIKDGGSRYATLSEIVFYEYDPIEEDITALFSNNLRTELEASVTLEDIIELEERLDLLADFVVSKTILQAELDLAKSLLDGSNSYVGYVKDDFVSINTSSDKGSKLSDISPLGVASFARYEVVIYADLPEGETLTIYPSQFYNSAGSAYSASNAIELKTGRNVISVPDLTNISGLVEGGQWYYTYSGDNEEDISLHFFKDIGIYQGIEYLSECVHTPTLELYNYDVQDDKEIIMQKIEAYINDLDDYTSSVVVDSTHPNYSNFNWTNNPTNNPLNTTEISLRHTLLSITVAGVNSTLGSGTIEERAEKLYNAICSWEEINYVTNRLYGDDITSDNISVRASRQNVRVMRMSATAFMYAGGNHIGIQYDSVPVVVPTSSQIHPNNLGWGIAHEIGHNLDRIGILEVTNNIYSMAVATYDKDGNYTPLNRIPWTTVFEKVSSGSTGSSSDIFAQLGMYWQLHLAYASVDDPLAYYSDLFAKYNDSSSYSGSNKFEVLASQTADKDLTDFFEAWGVQLSDDAKSEMSKLSEEDRKIQYLNEESIVYRINGEFSNIPSDTTFDIEAKVSEDNEQTVLISISTDLTSEQESMIQGYEIYRDGKLIGFTTDGNYSDYFGSMNNKSMEYELVMIDKLGNACSDKIKAPQVRIEYDNLVERDEYEIEVLEDGSGLKLVFETPTSISGFRLKDDFPNDGNFEVQIGVMEYDEYGDLVEDSEISYITARSNSFDNNEVDGDEKFISYFQKQGVEDDDTRIGTYDAKEIIITSEDIIDYKDNLDIISYVGDNVSFTDYVIGRLSHNFDMGGDIIEEGTIIVVGEYVGDPYFNEITINGRYVSTSHEGEQESYDVLVEGDTYMFATIPDDKVVSTISDGLFIFIPSVQSDHTHDDSATNCDHSSLFPTYMQAIMARNDSEGNARYTTYTSWEFCPSFDTIPDIVIE
ncbi:MAG: M60 family metallopeptidase [bacterium]